MNILFSGSEKKKKKQHSNNCLHMTFSGRRIPEVQAMFLTSCVWPFQPICKMLVKMGIFPNFRGENKTCLKPPSSNYHPKWYHYRIRYFRVFFVKSFHVFCSFILFSCSRLLLQTALQILKQKTRCFLLPPIGSTYGTFTYIYHNKIRQM